MRPAAAGRPRPPPAPSPTWRHGALDVEHIGDFERLVNRLETPEDREAVQSNAQTFFRLYGNVLGGIAIEENP
jgi:hypothetical protein